MTTLAKHPGRELRRNTGRKKLNKILCNWQLYLFLLPALAYFLIFRYYPMLGIQIAFKKFKAVGGIWGSPWVGFRNFEHFFHAADFTRLLTNTLAVSVETLLISFPVPIIWHCC